MDASADIVGNDAWYSGADAEPVAVYYVHTKSGRGVGIPVEMCILAAEKR